MSIGFLENATKLPKERNIYNKFSTLKLRHPSGSNLSRHAVAINI